MNTIHSSNNHGNQILDPMTLAFDGSQLIEASAGTGKTYTISGLYLRLLLGHADAEPQSNQALPKPLTCEQILVVTFTNAATEELRDRIRKRIALAHKCFLGLPVDDLFVTALYQSVPTGQRMNALRRLDLALKSLDEAAIFTIHGFCQRMLTDLAFESSLLFESEFTLDDSEYLHHAVRDFWREACYNLPSFLAKIIQSKFSSPDSLAQQIRPLLGASQAQTLKPLPAFEHVSTQLSQSLSRLQLVWPRQRDSTEHLLHCLPLSGVRFGKKVDNYPKLAKLFDEMDSWAAGTLSLPNLKNLEWLALSTLKLNKGGEVPTPEQAPLLAHIESLTELISAIVPSFLSSARQGISLRFHAQKQQRNLLTPDDLLQTLSQSLADDPSEQLATSIAKRFPVALIDEFQDTDPLQFSIFNQIYQQSVNHSQQLGLLMIGDPKQAIYAFRGADIFTYIQARNEAQNRYSLDTNYRSSAMMVQAVNQIFNLQADAFLSESIPFEAVNPSPSAAAKTLIDMEPHLQSAALRLKLLAEDPDNGLNKATARAQLAFDAGNEIAELLNQGIHGECHINGAPVQAKDICVLVRDRNEAGYIQQALSLRNIGSVFLSRDSVFDTLEAKEMALLLQAMANPRDERAIRSALATELVGYSAEAINQFNYDETKRQYILEQFFELHQTWLYRGIMPALLKLASESQLMNRLLFEQRDPDSSSTAVPNALFANKSSGSGERRLTDFRHLSELLQHKAMELDGINALVNWFEQALLNPNAAEEQQLRLESEQNLVQIVTIHKSKGLEYPICFIPFISLARSSRGKPAPMLYHQDKGEEKDVLIWDIQQSDEGLDKHKREVLAEDLRLLYVALTRPVYRCYLYIANHCRAYKSGNSSQLWETAIGYLLGAKDKDCDFAQLQNLAQQLVSQAVHISEVETNDALPKLFTKTKSLHAERLAPKKLNRLYQVPWRVGSYSGLVKNLAHHKVSPGADDEEFDVLDQDNGLSPVKDISDIERTLDRFSFERGATAGSFMHLVLELIDFTQSATELDTYLPEAMQQYGIDEIWLSALKEWYQAVLATTLNSANLQTNAFTSTLTLAALKPADKLVEMEFYLPIEQLDASALNQLLHHYGYSHDLTFERLQGMLKGFIDLSFQFEGQYFIADYKSNHLGDDFAAYDQQSMYQAIRGHRYDLQYILYTLAMHRFLKLRLTDYDYDISIGGCYYLFLRGMDPSVAGAGIYFDKPPRQLIEDLDKLFKHGAASISSQDNLSVGSQAELSL